MIKWSDEYLVGVASIDEQHKRLFEIAIEAEVLLKNEFCYDKYDEVMLLVKQLKEYTMYHFREEEMLMFKSRYEGFIPHKALHDTCITKLEDLLLLDIDEDQDSAIKRILYFVIDWITGHILQKDKIMVKSLEVE